MKEIELKLEENGKGAFVIEEGNERIAEMVIGISGNNLTVYHTEVSERLKGGGGCNVAFKNGYLCKRTKLESNTALSLCECTVQAPCR